MELAGDMPFEQVLRDRRNQLTLKLQQVVVDRENLNRIEARIIQHIRSIDILLGAEGDLDQNKSVIADDVIGTESTADLRILAPDIPGNGQTTATWSATDKLVTISRDTSESIYATVGKVLHQAGVPLHYRQLAEAVGQEIPLRGKDPGATLLAHLSRATDRFARVGRGIYWFANQPLPDGVVAQPTTSKRVKRKRRSR